MQGHCQIEIEIVTTIYFLFFFSFNDFVRAMIEEFVNYNH